MKKLKNNGQDLLEGYLMNVGLYRILGIKVQMHNVSFTGSFMILDPKQSEFYRLNFVWNKYFFMRLFDRTDHAPKLKPAPYTDIWDRLNIIL